VSVEGPRIVVDRYGPLHVWTREDPYSLDYDDLRQRWMVENYASMRRPSAHTLISGVLTDGLPLVMPGVLTWQTWPGHDEAGCWLCGGPKHRIDKMIAGMPVFVCPAMERWEWGVVS
jgi:hypothetical protein